VSVIDAKGKIVMPGLIDMHVHLRQPGREDKETIYTGTRAAVKGGITSVVTMANTEPVVDRCQIVKALKDAVKKDAACNVFIGASVTEKRESKKLTDITKLRKAGVLLVSDDGSSVASAELMKKALKECKKNNMVLSEHCEDKKISGSGLINEGFIATKLGLRGIPREAEYNIVKRDLELARSTKTKIHIAHVSCKESVELIRKAKKKGVKVTAETAPHYFVLTDECCVTYDTNTKVNPPLRGQDDVFSIKEALKDGTIDTIASDHAPHGKHEKEIEYEYAAFGIIGLETSLSLAIMELVEKDFISWTDLVRLMSLKPAIILGLDKKGNFNSGSNADIIILDPEEEWTYKEEMIGSKSKNSPFIDWKLKGRVTDTMVGGKFVVKDKNLII